MVLLGVPVYFFWRAKSGDAGRVAQPLQLKIVIDDGAGWTREPAQGLQV